LAWPSWRPSPWVQPPSAFHQHKHRPTIPVSASPIPLATRLAATTPCAMKSCTDTKAIARPAPFTDSWANFAGTSLRPSMPLRASKFSGLPRGNCRGLLLHSSAATGVTRFHGHPCWLAGGRVVFDHQVAIGSAFSGGLGRPRRRPARSTAWSTLRLPAHVGAVFAPTGRVASVVAGFRVAGRHH
jgi:hypothetical protein